MIETAGEQDLAERIRERAPGLPQALGHVAAYCLRHPDTVSTSSAAELGAATGTSDATVVRTARALGYRGVKEMRRAAAALISSRSDPGAVMARRIEQVSAGSSPFDRVVRDTVRGVESLGEFIAADEWEAAVDVLAAADRILVYGLPPVGFVAEHLALMLGRIGRSAVAGSATGVALADRLLSTGPVGAAVVFAPVRQFPEVTTVVRYLRDQQVPCVLVTEALDMPIAAEADHVLVTPRTSLDTAGESTLPLVVAQALLMSLAARDRAGSGAAMDRLHALRDRIAEDAGIRRRRAPAVEGGHG
ncbi:MurR/RpiR family transcriptional regulator [Pseudonocardia nematodicida]|uniref:MurR/RpiR family transcriptional regulator n=1 Tax=Pseudonocardia nematodicida TaxID=1206997 RepID=A0ABV1K4H9_9PSEU